MTQKLFRLIARLIVALAITFAGFTPALAASPSNDDFDFATMISGMPFTDSLDTSEATSALDDPTTCTNNGSVWYSFTPSTDMVIGANTFGSEFDTVLSAYTGTRGALTQVPGACNDDFNGTQSQVNFTAEAGTTYYFLIGFCCGSGGIGGGNLIFSVNELFPPSEDNFSSAMAISLLPFDDSVDTTAATLEPGEPTPSCDFGNTDKTIWYAFTPSTSGLISANFNFTSFSPVTAAYTGNSLTNLTEVGCRTFGSKLTFHAEAGTTYYFQVGGLFGEGGTMGFHLEVTPPIEPNFFFFPSDPSVFDTVQFCDNSFDPGEVSFQSFTWDFGDGVTSTDNCAVHQYPADGDYTVQHSVTTFDGRTASASPQVVQVRTHDVSITKVAAPKSANVGQTRTITVSIKNNRYPETVRIELYKGIPGGGFQLIGVSTQFVPVRSGNRTSQFIFNYTFSPQDAQIGKVTFRAVVIIENANDALPADNEAISTPPTIVKR